MGRCRLNDLRAACRVATQKRRIIPPAINRDVVAGMEIEISLTANHDHWQAFDRGGTGAHHVADNCHAPRLNVHFAPFEFLEVVLDGALARIVNEIVDDGAVHAALEERTALKIMRVEISIDQDIADIVMDQRPFGMFTLGVGRVGKPFRNQVVRKRDLVRRALAPFIRCFACEARTGG